MAKLILLLTISLIYGSFMQDENSSYTTIFQNDEWSTKSMSSHSRIKEMPERSIIMKKCLYYNFFRIPIITKTCLDVLSKVSHVAFATSMNTSSKEFSINITYLRALGIEALWYVDFKILLHYLKSVPSRVPVNIFEDVVNIMNYGIDANYFPDEFFETFVDFVQTLDMTGTHLVAIAPKLVVAVWRPFLSNFTGILWIKAASDKLESQIVTINCTSYNGSLEFNVNRTEMAACIHPSFLEELASTLSEEEKKKIYVVLILSMGNYLFADHLYRYLRPAKFYREEGIKVVGFSIPGYCIQNHQTILNISFDGRSSHSFRKDYLDPSYVWQRQCSLSEIMFVYRVQTVNNAIEYIESVKAKNCLQDTKRYGIQIVRWSQTPIYKYAYPDSFCVDGNYTVPSRLCSIYGFTNLDHIECSQVHELSSDSNIFYKYATKCREFESFSIILQHFINSTVLNLLDKHLFLMAIDCITRNILHDCERELETHWCSIVYTHLELNLKVVHAAVHKGIEIAVELNKIEIVEDFMRYLFTWIIVNYRKKETLEIYPRYIYCKQQRIPFGMVIFKGDGTDFSNYQAKVLTSENMTTEYMTDPKVENIIIMSSNTSYKAEITVLVLRDKSISPNASISLSRAIILFSNIGWYLDVEIKLYLKIINFKSSKTMLSHTGEGHWIVIPKINSTLAGVTVFEKKDDFCVGEKYAVIYEDFNTIIETKKLIQEPIDLLSAISFSINTADTVEEIEQIYHKHLFTFNILRVIGGTLSCMGAVVIFCTTLMLKGWYKTKFNIIQLTTTLAIQLPLFLVNTSVSHIKILIFYYCILCQFSCTSVIGYIQYTKYVAIFKSGTISRLQSIIIGWIIPLMIILASLLFYGGCLKCHLCHKNNEIFMFFVFVPVVTIIVGNSIVYVVAMINIWSTPKLDSEDVKLRIKVAIFLPLVLGITWIFVVALIAPWSWLTLSGLFLIHLVLPSQAFALFVFVILLDKQTRDQWKNYLAPICGKGIKPGFEPN